MTSQDPSAAQPRPDPDSLPVGLWIGTAVFAVVAAGLLFLAMKMGRSRLVGSADKVIEKQAVEAK